MRSLMASRITPPAIANTGDARSSSMSSARTRRAKARSSAGIAARLTDRSMRPNPLAMPPSAALASTTPTSGTASPENAAKLMTASAITPRPSGRSGASTNDRGSQSGTFVPTSVAVTIPICSSLPSSLKRPWKRAANASFPRTSPP